MPSTTYEVTQYAATCLECGWYGDVYNDYDDGETLAEEDMDEHNKEFH